MGRAPLEVSRRAAPSGVAFRRARLPDVTTLLWLVREFYDFARLPFDAGVARAALAGLLEDSSLGAVWLIEDGDETLGYAVLTLGYSLEYGGRDAYLDELYIRPDQRSRGIGAETIAFLEAECHARGVRALHLEVERWNARAYEFYRRVGFVDLDRHLMNKWMR